MGTVELVAEVGPRERARLLAAHRIASDPQARAQVEAVYGVDFCRVNYPEAYRPGWAKTLDGVRKIIPFPFQA